MKTINLNLTYITAKILSLLNQVCSLTPKVVSYMKGIVIQLSLIKFKFEIPSISESQTQELKLLHDNKYDRDVTYKTGEKKQTTYYKRLRITVFRRRQCWRQRLTGDKINAEA